MMPLLLAASARASSSASRSELTERFLTDRVLARAEHLQDLLEVQVWRGAQVHHVELVVALSQSARQV
jgi:hypothetical protein